MRLIFPIIACLALGSGSAFAVETFIPPGYSLSLNNQERPAFNSPSDEITRRADELQTEIYVKQRHERRMNVLQNRFENSRPLKGGDYSVGY